MKTILCFGDSNTHGYDAETNGRFSEKVRWPGKLGEILGPSYSVKEEGLSGRTCVYDDPLFAGLNGFSFIDVALLTHEPVDTLIIMLGTNDTKARFNVNAANIAKGMERLIVKAKNQTDAWRNGKVDIILVSPPPIAEGNYESGTGQEMGAGCIEKSRELCKYYQEVASRQGIRFLDAGKIPGALMNDIDFMHLTASSHEKLAVELSRFFIK